VLEFASDEFEIKDLCEYFSFLFPVLILIQNQWIFQQKIEAYFVRYRFPNMNLSLRWKEGLYCSWIQQNQGDYIVSVGYDYVMLGPRMFLLIKGIFVLLLTERMNICERYFEGLKRYSDDFISKGL